MNSTARDAALNGLFAPRSVAIVGASTDPTKWGHMLSRTALDGAHRRDVYLVNRKGQEILGRHSVRRLADLDETPELAVVVVPNESFEATVDEVLEVGTRSIVAITAGFSETGELGREREQAVARRVQSHGAVMIGPNCNGTFDASAEFSCMAFTQPPPGDIAMISQSGSVIQGLGSRLKSVGLGIGRAASVGNQADVKIADLVRSCAASDSLRAIVLYIEDALDGRELFREVSEATAAGTPVIVLSPDSDEVVSRAAMSHTGALVSSHQVIAEASRQAGAWRASSFAETVNMVQAVLSPARPVGRRTAVIADGGGYGVLAASAAIQAGLEMPILPPDVQEFVAARLLPGAGVANPIDLVGAMDVRDLPPILATILANSDVDGALLNISEFIHDTPELERDVGRQLAHVAVGSGKAVVLATNDLNLPGPRAAAEAGIPVYTELGPAANALAALATMYGHVPTAPSCLPTPATPLTLTPEDYLGAREAVERAGVPFAKAIAANTPTDAVAAADTLGYPVVVKALGLLHKSDAGGVALGLDSPESVLAAATRMQDSFKPVGFAVEEMVRLPDSVELIIGAHHDPHFGPVVLVGLGGVYSEILRDTALMLAPTTEAAVVSKLQGLRGAALLNGARGKLPIDIDGVAQLVVRISEFVAAHPEIKELDLNPVLAGPTSAVALDARIVI